MRKPKLPELPETGRRYVDNTLRARLGSPGVERHRSRAGSTGARVGLAAVAIVALVGAMLWLAR